jgi:hypothetical protein
MAIPTPNSIEILDPTIRSAAAVLPAPRLRSLDGKTIGLLDNSKEKADVFLATLAERLGQRFALANVVRRRKPTYSRVAPASLLAELCQTCDSVLTAMGA